MTEISRYYVIRVSPGIQPGTTDTIGPYPTVERAKEQSLQVKRDVLKDVGEHVKVGVFDQNGKEIK